MSDSICYIHYVDYGIEDACPVCLAEAREASPTFIFDEATGRDYISDEAMAELLGEVL